MEILLDGSVFIKIFDQIIVYCHVEQLTKLIYNPHPQFSKIKTCANDSKYSSQARVEKF